MGLIDNKTNIVMASDNRGFAMMSVAIYSVIKNNPNQNIQFWIFHSDISNENQKSLLKLNTKFADIKFIDIDNVFLKDVEVTNTTVTIPTFYRYLTPDILKDQHRALYMDIDMICLKNLNNLYKTDIGDSYIGGVEDYFVSVTDDYPGFKEGIGLNKNAKFINSGLLLMNLDLLRSSGIMTTFWSNIKNKSKIIPKQYNIFADQTIANITFKDKIYQLNKRYNVIVSSLQYTKQKDVAIAHFAGPDKPFRCYNSYSAKYSDIYYDYLIQTNEIMEVDSTESIKSIMTKLGEEKNDLLVKLSEVSKIAKDKSHHVEELLYQLNEEKENSRKKIKVLEDKIYIMENSKSWKITKPIREIKKLKPQKRN